MFPSAVRRVCRCRMPRHRALPSSQHRTRIACAEPYVCLLAWVNTWTSKKRCCPPKIVSTKRNIKPSNIKRGPHSSTVDPKPLCARCTTIPRGHTQEFSSSALHWIFIGNRWSHHQCTLSTYLTCAFLRRSSDLANKCGANHGHHMVRDFNIPRI